MADKIQDGGLNFQNLLLKYNKFVFSSEFGNFWLSSVILEAILNLKREKAENQDGRRHHLTLVTQTVFKVQIFNVMGILQLVYSIHTKFTFIFILYNLYLYYFMILN